MVQVLLIAGIVLLIGVLLLILFLVRLVRRLTFNDQEGKPHEPPPGVSYWAIFVAVIFLFSAWALFWTASLLKSFKAYQPNSVAGIIEIQRQADPVKSMKFDYYPAPAESLASPATFYLSGNTWYLKGQFIEFSGLFAKIIGWSHFYKISDFFSDYKGHKPPGVSSAMLSHEPISGGYVDLDTYFNFFNFLKSAIRIEDFQSEDHDSERFSKYWLVLSDSSRIMLATSEPELR
jgi:hypothetical protein